MQTSVVDMINTTGTGAAEPAGGAGELGRNEFLALLVAKLENQDPLDPAKDTEFVAQLATFSSLEQLISVNDNLEDIAGSQAELINSQALSLIGKEALVESDNQIRIKDGQPDTLVYVIPRQARDATLTIVDNEGIPVQTFELEKSPQGRLTLEWDGTDSNGDALPDGDYRIELNVTDTEGEPMAIALFRSVPIEGVNFLNGFISLISGDREIPFEMILEIREGRAPVS